MVKRYLPMTTEDNSYTLDCLMSDRQKALLKAAREVLPHTYRCYCMKHLEANFDNAFKDSCLVGLFCKAATTYREAEHEEVMKMMKRHNLLVESFFKDAPSDKWAYCKFPGKRYGQLTTSISDLTAIRLVLTEGSYPSPRA